MIRLASIGEASKALGVSIPTLRRWDLEGKLVPQRTPGGQRRYDLSCLFGEYATAPETRVTIAYARVSSHDQKADLDRQRRVLEMFCTARGWTFEMVSDLGSGLNYQKEGLRSLLDGIVSGRVGRLVITHKDRLLRFGADLVFSMCEAKSVEVVVINQGDQAPFEEELAKDVLEIITVFSARLYGSRSRKNQRLLEAMKKAVEDEA